MAAGVPNASFFHLHTPTEIDGCFDAILSDMWRAYLGCDRPYRVFSRQLLTLNFMALATNCITYTFIDLQPKEGLEVAELGWKLYSSVQPKNRENAVEKYLVPIFYQGIEVGAIFLGHIAMLLAALGRYKEATKAWSEFVDFSKSFEGEAYKLTSFLPKTMEIMFRTWQGETTTRKNYYSFMADAAEMASNAPNLVPRVLCGLGFIVASTSSTPSHPTLPSMGVDICERSVLESIKYGGEFADLPMCNFVVAAYYHTGKHWEGLLRTEQFLNKINIIGVLGPAYCNLLKLKGDCMVRLYGNGNEKDKEKEKDNKHKLSEAFQVYQNSLLVAHSIGHSVCEMEALIAIANMSTLTGNFNDYKIDDISSKITSLWKSHEWSDVMASKIKPFLV